MNSGPSATAASRGKCPDLTNLNDTDLLARFFQDRWTQHLRQSSSGMARSCMAFAGGSWRIRTTPKTRFRPHFWCSCARGNAPGSGQVSSWLYGVAHRTARKLRTKAMLQDQIGKAGEPDADQIRSHDMTYERAASGARRRDRPAP